jgi:hypothetical protein
MAGVVRQPAAFWQNNFEFLNENNGPTNQFQPQPAAGRQRPRAQPAAQGWLVRPVGNAVPKRGENLHRMAYNPAHERPDPSQTPQ